MDDFPFIGTFTTIAGFVAGAIVTTLLTMWRENRNREALAQDWINQQWWQGKADAYTQVIEALWQRLEYVREYEESLYTHESSSPYSASDKYQDMDRRKRDLRRASDVGAFVISDKAADALQRYFKRDAEIMQMIDLTDQVEADLEATEQCLVTVKTAALMDLRLSQKPSN